MNFHERTEQAMATIAAMDALLRDWDGREAHYYLADQHRLATGGL